MILHFSLLLPPANANPDPPVTTLPTLQILLDMLTPSQKWAFDYVDIPLNLHSIISVIQTHQCIVISDSGVAAFMLQSQHDHIEVKGVH